MDLDGIHHEHARLHDRLAEVSAVLRVDAALVVDRFVLAFDEHARREESLFAELARSRR